MAIAQVTNITKFSSWKDITNAIIDGLGDTTGLDTTDKTSAVVAINELLTKLGAISALNTTDKSNVVAAINEVLTQLGAVGSLAVDFVAEDAVAALNELLVKIGDLTNLNTTIKTNLVSAVNEVNTALTDGLQAVADDLGDKNNLTTTVKSTFVAAINELDGEIGDLTTLTTTVKTAIVAAINELDGEVGVLSSLTTTNKTAIVAAINEVVAAQLTRADVPVENILTNHGRFSAETSKVLTTFDATLNQLVAYNAAGVTQGDRFLDDNSNYGGAGGALGSSVASLMTAIGGAGRADNRNGYEFFLGNVTQGGGTADGETFSAELYYPMFEGADTFLGQIGSTVTFQCWARVTNTADEPTYGGTKLGDTGGLVTTFVDDVEQAQESILAVADGWVHIRQTFTLTNEFVKFFPAIFANVGDIVEIALPTLFNANIDNGIHLGIQ